jgi:hypothetical protein
MITGPGLLIFARGGVMDNYRYEQKQLEIDINMQSLGNMIYFS